MEARLRNAWDWLYRRLFSMDREDRWACYWLWWRGGLWGFGYEIHCYLLRWRSRRAMRRITCGVRRQTRAVWGLTESIEVAAREMREFIERAGPAFAARGEGDGMI